ncbi:MAG: hypothetical protein K6E10_03320 [Eubacterium sp.]|nr:hypothetical protein [Eubacterium sp.]
MGCVKKGRKSSKRILVGGVSLLMVLSVVFGNVAGVREVRADDSQDIGEVSEVKEDNYCISDGSAYRGNDGEKQVHPDVRFSEESFDKNGNLTIGFMTGDSKYNLVEKDKTTGKIYLNKSYYVFGNEYIRDPKYLILNEEKLIKIEADGIVLNKSDFEKVKTYIGKMSGVTLEVVDAMVRGEWYKGFYFDENGDSTYPYKGEWKGAPSELQWYEDESGWYPKSQWAKADKFFQGCDIQTLSDGSRFGYRSSLWSSSINGTYVSGAWFYFEESGYAAYNGWYDIDGIWYYFSNYIYESSCWRDGYYLDSEGAQSYAYKGSWKSNDSGWWFEDEAGWYPYNQSEVIDGETYYFLPSGYLATDMWIAPGECGTYEGNSSWIHVDSSGLEDKSGCYNEKGEWIENEY